MKQISVREMKAHWSEIEKQLREGETFEVTNRGRPAARLVPPGPRKVVKWPDFLSDAIEVEGQSMSDLVIESREERC